MRPALLALCLVIFAAGCSTDDRRHYLLVSVPDQKMLVLRDKQPLAVYPVSTSKYGLGDGSGTYTTPLGIHRIREKIGAGAPLGAVFKSRRLTGEVLPVDAPGRDPIVTRILWLEGLETQNRRSFERYIYIHGTPEERNIGRPVSYGCIRMRSRDVAELYDIVGLGARVEIIPAPLPIQIVPSGDTPPPAQPSSAQETRELPVL